MSPHRSPTPLTPEIPPVVPLSFPSAAWECVPAKLCFALLINPPDSGFAPLGRFAKRRLNKKNSKFT